MHTGTTTGCATASPPPSGCAACRPSRGAGGPTTYYLLLATYHLLLTTYHLLQAISWSWRPDACALAPVRGEAFDRWLGPRHMLIIGDSLTAQLYYSLIWLLGDTVQCRGFGFGLGDTVLEQHDL
jgi:hypothetical protein